MNKINCLNFAYLFKASVGSINGSWTEGNVSTIKKVTLPNGSQIPYVSGQSLKFQIRKYWKESGLKLSEVANAEKVKGVDPTLGDPINYIDDDLLGYMIASTKEDRRRTAPVRISPAIGAFEFQGDIDLGTKSKELTGEDMSSGGNIFETEISYNFYRVNALVELDRIGYFIKQELADKGEDVLEIDHKERCRRIGLLLDGFRHIWGGGKQSRLLTDMSPKLIVFTLQKAKNPILLEGLKVTKDESLRIDALLQTLDDHRDIIEKSDVFIGMRKGIFANETEIEEKVASAGYGIRSISETFDAVKKLINEIEF